MDGTPFPLDESFTTVLLETTHSLVCVYDRDGRILLFNGACERATGFRRDEVLGRDARETVIPPEEREAFGEFLAYVWKTGASAPQVGHWQTKEGGRRLIAWANKLLGETFVTSGDDLTERDLTFDAPIVPGGDAVAEQAALRRVATLVAAEASPTRVFTAVSEECARVLRVNASSVLRYGEDATATVVGRHNRDRIDVFSVGERVEASEESAVGRVLRTGAPARTDDWRGHRGAMIDAMFRVGYRSSAAAPIVVSGALWGAVAIASEDPLPPDTEHRLGAFCELASLAVASAQARADLVASRARLVEAGDEQRRRLERNLHDGAQQHLVSVALTLRVARSQAHSSPEITSRLLEEAARELDSGLEALRELARGLHPAVLNEHGLGRALDALAERMPVPVEIVAPADRLPAQVEATVYYIVSEALTNVAKHAQASRARVVIRRDGELLRCAVSDDGRGGADTANGSGLVGLRDRAEAAGGTLSLVSPPGSGTVVTAALPLS